LPSRRSSDLAPRVGGSRRRRLRPASRRGMRRPPWHGRPPAITGYPFGFPYDRDSAPGVPRPFPCAATETPRGARAPSPGPDASSLTLREPCRLMASAARSASGTARPRGRRSGEEEGAMKQRMGGALVVGIVFGALRPGATAMAHPPADDLEPITGVDAQPLIAQARRIADALDFVGSPLEPAEKSAL